MLQTTIIIPVSQSEYLQTAIKKGNESFGKNSDRKISIIGIDTESSDKYNGVSIEFEHPGDLFYLGAAFQQAIHDDMLDQHFNISGKYPKTNG